MKKVNVKETKKFRLQRRKRGKEKLVLFGQVSSKGDSLETVEEEAIRSSTKTHCALSVRTGDQLMGTCVCVLEERLSYYFHISPFAQFAR